MKNKYFIGEWGLDVLITYLGLFCAIVGIYQAFLCKIPFALASLILSGLCDLVDGPIARTFDRTKEQKLFGIQIDSLVDTVSFLCLPVVILLSVRLNLYNLLVSTFYVICGVARLAYFNVNSELDKILEYYSGLPVTYISLILPICYIPLYYIGLFKYFAGLIYLIVGVFFILNIPVKKPTRKVFPFFFILALICGYFLLEVG